MEYFVDGILLYDAMVVPYVLAVGEADAGSRADMFTVRVETMEAVCARLFYQDMCRAMICG